jgi:hypothetical protein
MEDSDEPSTMEDPDDSSINSFSTAELDALQDHEIKKVQLIYKPAKLITELETEGIRMRINDDAKFVELLAENEFLFSVFERMMETARTHVVIKCESLSAIWDMIVHEFARRTELCVLYSKKILSDEKDYTIDVINKVEGEIRRFVMTLEPFVLTEKEDMQDDNVLRATPFGRISTLYRTARHAQQGTMVKLEKMRENEEKSLFSAGDDEKEKSVEFDTDSMTKKKPVTSSHDATEMPAPVPLPQHSSQESVDQHEESQTSIVTSSTYFGSPSKK